MAGKEMIGEINVLTSLKPSPFLNPQQARSQQVTCILLEK